jgi:hypothetical protein
MVMNTELRAWITFYSLFQKPTILSSSQAEGTAPNLSTVCSCIACRCLLPSIPSYRVAHNTFFP